jgi:hypothetical protein
MIQQDDILMIQQDDIVMIQHATLSLQQSLLSTLSVATQLVGHRRERKCEDMKRTLVTLFATVVLLQCLLL